jgi:putative acetyltransferase
VKIRNLEIGEEILIWDLFYSTIHNINIHDYTEAQINAWAPSDLDEQIWKQKFQSIKPFVAEVCGCIVGYSDLQPSGLIDHLFVHYQWQRKGVGRALIEEIEKRAVENNIALLETHASITARPFFEAQGFTVSAEQLIEIRGQKLKNYVMHRQVLCT